MARVEIPFVIQTATGDAVVGASIQVNRRDGTAATVYTQEEGPTTLPNPMTTGTAGQINGWLEEGQYNLLVTGSGITAYTQPFDAVSAGPESRRGDAVYGNIGPADQGGVGFGPDPIDAYIYRPSAGALRTNGSFTIDGQAAIGGNRLVGTSTSLAIQDSTGAGLFRSILSASGFTDNQNTPRGEYGNNTTNNRAIISGLTGVALTRLGISASGTIIGNVAAGALAVPTADSLTLMYAGGRDTLSLSSTSGETGITIGGDVELYRRIANVLATPDTFEAAAYRVGTTPLDSTHLNDATNIALRNATQTFSGVNTFTGTVISETAAAGFPLAARTTGDTNARFAVRADGRIELGPGNAARSVFLLASGTDLGLTGSLTASANVTGNSATIGSVTGGTGLSAGGAVLYGAAGMWRTAQSLTVDTNLLLGTTTQRGRLTLPTGTTVADGISFGTSATAKTDRVDVFRSAAGIVTLDGSITITGNLTVTGSTTSSTAQSSSGALTAAAGQPGEVTIGATPSGSPTARWGTGANAAEIYQDGNDKLRTADAFQVDGAFTAINGATVTSNPLNVDRASATDPALVIRQATVARARILADGTHEWADSTGTFDTPLARTSPGVLRLTGTFNSTLGYQVNGLSLRASHLNDGTTGTGGSIVLSASPTITGTLTAATTTLSGVLTVIAGNSSAPGITWSGDSDTGIYSPGADQLALATSGVARLSVAANGTVNAVNGLTVGGSPVVTTGDPRLSDARTPSGTAGGALAGFYPNPALADGAILNIHIASNAAIADTKLAQITTAGKVAASAIDGAIARLASPTFTGTPGMEAAAVTPAAGTDTQQLATLKYVNQLRGTATPLINGTAALGTAWRYAREDHVHPTDTSRAATASPTFTGTITAQTINLTTLQVSGTNIFDRANTWSAAQNFAAITSSGQLTVGGHSIIFNPRTTLGALTVSAEETSPGSGTYRSLIGFHSVGPVPRPATRTFSNWNSGTNALRTIDRNSWTFQQLYDFVMTMAYDLQLTGLY